MLTTFDPHVAHVWERRSVNSKRGHVVTRGDVVGHRCCVHQSSTLSSLVIDVCSLVIDVVFTSPANVATFGHVWGRRPHVWSASVNVVKRGHVFTWSTSMGAPLSACRGYLFLVAQT